MRSRRQLDRLLANLPANPPPELSELKFSPALIEKVKERISQPSGLTRLAPTAERTFLFSLKSRAGIAAALGAFLILVLAWSWLGNWGSSATGLSPSTPWTRDRTRNVSENATADLPLPFLSEKVEESEEPVTVPYEVFLLPRGQGAIIWTACPAPRSSRPYYLFLYVEEGKLEPQNWEQAVTIRASITSKINGI